MKQNSNILIRNAHPEEYPAIGELLVRVYAQLEGFPKESEQPHYYQLLRNVEVWKQYPGTDIIVATDASGHILGAVVYFNDMQYYGSGGTATVEKDSAGFRLLAVHEDSRGLGIGKRLTQECIRRAEVSHRKQVIIHTTGAMIPAWKMYEKLGFRRSEDLDFMQEKLPVFGFRYNLNPDSQIDEPSQR